MTQAHLTLRILSLLLSISCHSRAQTPAYRFLTGKAQGTTYHISYRPTTDTLPSIRFDSILLSVDKSLSLYDSSSLICAFNRSTHGIRMDAHMRVVITHSLALSASSKGAFDITVKPVMDAWGFGAHTVTQVPTRRMIDSLKRIIGYRHLIVRNDSLLKDDPAIRIDCNGIAQGYTVDLLSASLMNAGISDYLVELGGEIRLQGLNPAGLPWYVGIEDPALDRIPHMNGRIQPGSGAITTSANHRNLRSIQGRMIGHVMDPRTAMPASQSVLSVCISAADATTADALDNTCMVLGVRKSLRWLRRFKGAEMRMVYRNRYGRMRIKTSKGFPPVQGV